MMCVHTPTNIEYYWSNIHVLGSGREYRVCTQILVRINWSFHLKVNKSYPQYEHFSCFMNVWDSNFFIFDPQLFNELFICNCGLFYFASWSFSSFILNQHPYIKVFGLFMGGFHLLLALCHNIWIDVFVQHLSMFWTFYLVFLLCTCTLAMSLLQPPSSFKYYLLFSGTRITTFKSTLSIVDSYSIPPQFLLIILLIIPTHKKDGWEGNLLFHVWNMLVFGPTLHHPSTKHQALVKNIKMQHLANLLEKNPQNSTIIKVDLKVSYSPFNMALNFF